MLRLTMLPARDGDCLVLAYGEGQNVHRVLVDGGRASTAAAVARHLGGLTPGEREFEALVVTHIDADHITGVLKLVEGRARPAIGDIWFNAYHHLVEAAAGHPSYEAFSAAQGERLSDVIAAAGIPWNAAFQGRAASIEQAGLPRRLELAGGLVLSLLSPDRGKLARLAPFWRAELAAAGLDRSLADLPETPIRRLERLGGSVLDVEALAARREDPDAATPNGSSIAFVAEWQGRRILFGADAHPDIVAASLAPLAAAEGGRYRIDLLKVSHHGSAANTTRAMLELIDCAHFAFSTDGTKHGHPDPETPARILRFCSPGRPKTFHFNYRQSKTNAWDDSDLMRRHDYRCVFPDETNDGWLDVVLV